MRVADRFFCAILPFLITVGCDGKQSNVPERPAGPPVVVYAARDAAFIQSVLDAYSKETGVRVLLTTETSRALINKLGAEKHRSTADLVIADGIGHLWRAASNDILRPSNSELLKSKIPKHLRDSENLWFALLVSGRAIAYDKRSLDSRELTNYAALGDERWREKLCLSSATNTDNQSQIAMMIAEHGDQPTELIVRSWIANLAISVVADSATLLKEIEEGRCSLGIVSSVDAARHAREAPDSSVALFWPQETYIDVVAAAVTRHAGNPAGALQVLEWLWSDKGQKLLAAEKLEYAASQELPFESISSVDLAGAGYYLEDAVRLMERAHYRH